MVFCLFCWMFAVAVYRFFDVRCDESFFGGNASTSWTRGLEVGPTPYVRAACCVQKRSR